MKGNPRIYEPERRFQIEYPAICMYRNRHTGKCEEERHIKDISDWSFDENATAWNEATFLDWIVSEIQCYYPDFIDSGWRASHTYALAGDNLFYLTIDPDKEHYIITLKGWAFGDMVKQKAEIDNYADIIYEAATDFVGTKNVKRL